MEAETAITLVLLACGALFCLQRTWSSLDKARTIEDTPTSKIASAAQGYVELIGAAKPDQKLLIAPLTSTHCLWYRYKVERYVDHGKHSSWQIIRSGASDTSFFLEDDTGRCHVHPEGADVKAFNRDRWRGGSEVPIATAGGIIKTSLPIWDNNMFSSGRYRYTEERIHPEDLLYGIGLFQSIRPENSSAQTESKMMEILSDWKRDHAALLERFDTNNDGDIDQAEWRLARREAAIEAKSYVLENYDSESAHILCKSPVRSQHFILSCKNPDKLVKRYRWWALAYFVVFLALVAFFARILAG